MSKNEGNCKKIRKGDKVIGLAGEIKGQKGTVLSRIGDKVIVQGFNVRKKHVKASQVNPRGGVVELEKPVHISNLRVCNQQEQPVKLKVHVTKSGERQLVYKLDGKDVLYRSLKKPI
jgi:large subunit ribosomal protein L24